jgi:hypothetical protein
MSARPVRGVAPLAGQIRLALLWVTLAAILVATVGALAVGSHYLLAQTRAHLVVAAGPGPD